MQAVVAVPLTPADFDHIYWHCQPIREFWMGVTKTIQGLLSLPFPLKISAGLGGRGGTTQGSEDPAISFLVLCM